ncbi:hypothetical protein HBI16_217600 [Parastagonospora nodorum]|nr:hypothetical protein HBH42_206420 [Parastagonospora nodorum]KAH5755955.1 hypothetical protein HBI16_217600 [Parastagonospora nodorum]
MRFHSFLVLGAISLTSSTAYASSSTETTHGHRRSLSRRQDGPIAPDTATDCTYYEMARDSSMNCGFFEQDWGLTHEQFVDYNPSLKNDCSGIIVGNSYCVEVNNGLPRPPTNKPTSTSTSIRPSATASKKPSPTQPGLIDSCTDFYFAVDSDRCDSIVAKYSTFTYDDFVKWNPAVGSSCSGIWAQTWYCVAVPGTPTVRPSLTSATPTPTGAGKPSPTREGMIDTCNKFHFVAENENCDTLIKMYGTFTFEEFLKWNPAVGSNCGGLWKSTYFCVGVPTAATTAKPTITRSTFATSTRPSTSTFTMACILQFVNGQYYCVEDPKSCNPNAPENPQPSPICGCKRWHKVADKDNCDTIIKRYSISRADFNSWNSKINDGGDCKTLWLGYNVCVGIK